MKRKSLLKSLPKIICFMLLSLCACSSSINQNQSSTDGVAKTEQNQQLADKELIKQIEVFSGDVGEVGQNAWKVLQSHPREKLLQSLLSLQSSLANNDALQPRIAFALCNLDYEYESNKQVINSALKDRSKYENFSTDQAETLLSRLVSRGDKKLLRDLFTAAPSADGALAEGLADTFAYELQEYPEKFLLELKNEPKNVRRSVYELINDVDSLTDIEIKKLKAYLSSVSRRSPIYEIAREVRSSVLSHYRSQ